MRDSRYPVRNGQAIDPKLVAASAAWLHNHRYVWCMWCGTSGKIRATSDGTSIKCLACQTISQAEM